MRDWLRFFQAIAAKGVGFVLAGEKKRASPAGVPRRSVDIEQQSVRRKFHSAANFVEICEKDSPEGGSKSDVKEEDGIDFAIFAGSA